MRVWVFAQSPFSPDFSDRTGHPISNAATGYLVCGRRGRCLGGGGGRGKEVAGAKYPAINTARYAPIQTNLMVWPAVSDIISLGPTTRMCRSAESDLTHTRVPHRHFRDIGAVHNSVTPSLNRHSAPSALHNTLVPCFAMASTGPGRSPVGTCINCALFRGPWAT